MRSGTYHFPLSTFHFLAPLAAESYGCATLVREERRIKEL